MNDQKTAAAAGATGAEKKSATATDGNTTDRKTDGTTDGTKDGTTMTGASILWECLEREGVKHVFGYPGGAILPAYDALKHSNIHHVLVRHEQGATHMADGYARAPAASGRGRCHFRPGRHQHGHRNRHGHDGFLAHRLHHRTGGQQADRLRRLSGDGHHRRHPAHHQAQLSGDARRAKWRGRSARPFTWRSPAVPARCWWTSPRTRSSPRANSTGKPRSRSCPATAPIFRPRPRNTSRRWS